MNLLSKLFIGETPIHIKKADIVEKLLQNSQITAKEASILLTGNLVVNIDKVDVSSGGRIIGGDDNSSNTR